ncbi:uncharacterized protein BXZ73DRAFT_103563 [Epithele typhae]|uniref:uncharacterized protein n=1 Tax=Epithele typhae TaxID=378194 RepID=UPI002008E24E|nr:uncharacterized protein BXZ73DRAFT_103563 [Epithele typhae]KAH9924274.1 hypothetical protein BXZ73DRAFT_103563 [Epithele typhae]
MSSPRIPIDVAEMVIDAVAAHGDFRTLARCVRVCKSWFSRSRYRLWHRLTLSRGEQLSAVCDTLTHDTSLRSMVQIVRLETPVPRSDADKPPPLPIAAIVVLLPYLGHITAWEFHGRFLPFEPILFPTSPAILACLRQYRALRKLVLQDCVFMTSLDLHRLANAFPALQDVRMDAKVHIYDALEFTHLRTLSPPPICTATFGGQVPGRRDHTHHAGTFALSADERYLLSDVAPPASSSSSIQARTSICVWTLATGSCEPHFLRYHDSALPGTDTKFHATALRQPQAQASNRHPALRRGRLARQSDDRPARAAPGGPPLPLARVLLLRRDARARRHARPLCLVLDTLTGATIASLDGGCHPALVRGVSPFVALSGDGRVAAIGRERLKWWLGGQNNEWWTWRLEDGTLRKVLGHEDGVSAVWIRALSRDGSVAGFATARGDVFFRDVGDRFGEPSSGIVLA